jgi:dTDP-4-dehydrorhamnose reductase
MTNVILFGKYGQVASDLLKIFKDKDNFKIYNYSSQDIDFSNLDILAQKLTTLPKADFIINATAYNKVDDAEDKQDLADAINHKAVQEIAKYCKKQKTTFIHYSTNYVFDGKGNKPYEEDNIKNLNPLSIYGKSKLAGEQAIITSQCSYLIFRVATVFNLNQENNFVGKIKKLVQTHQELKIITDQITNPTNSFDIAKATIAIIEQNIHNKKNYQEIYHLASHKPISYYEFACDIIEKLKTQQITLKANKITAVTSNEFITKATRPLNGALNCAKVKKEFAIEI